MTIILHPKSGTRILRPDECRKLIRAIPRAIDAERFELLLYTGCRYTELIDLYSKKHRLDGDFLKIMNTKAKVVDKFRYVRLNLPGVRAVERYFRHSDPLSSYQVWDRNLIRWAKKAGIDSKGISLKTTRKTWESWLVTKYPRLIEFIFLSIGHDSITALKHYLQLPYSLKDRDDMDFFTDGWDKSIGEHR